MTAVPIFARQRSHAAVHAAHTARQRTSTVIANQQRQRLMQNALLARQAVTLVAARAPELSIPADAANPIESFIDQVQQLPPERRRELVRRLAGVVATLLATANSLANPRPLPISAALIALALTVYDLLLAIQNIDGE